MTGDPKPVPAPCAPGRAPHPAADVAHLYTREAAAAAVLAELESLTPPSTGAST